MRKVLFLLLLFFLFINKAFGLWVSWHLYEWENITISWSGFWNYKWLYSDVCVNDNCYIWTIVSWSDRKIVFKFPYSQQNRGTISIYTTIERQSCWYTCYTFKEKELVWTISYEISPKIKEVSIDQKYISTYWLPGEMLYIYGTGFWNNKWEVIFWRYKANIVSWANKKIQIKLPELTNWAENFKVKSSNWESSTIYSYKLYPHISNDTYSPYQHYLNEINYTNVWHDKKFSKKWDGITVAVIDSWLNHNNLDIKHSIWKNAHEIPNNWIDDDNNWYIDDTHGWNFVKNSNAMDITDSHGTQVAGIIAAKSNNNIWIAWIAENTKIMPLIVFHWDKWGKQSEIIEAIKYAADNGANIINLSLWGVYTNSFSHEYDEAIRYAYEKWLVIVVASWNWDYTNTGTSRDLDIYKSSPVCNDWNNWNNYIIWVSATDQNRKKAGFADYGKNCIDISAPGINIASTSHKAFTTDGKEYELYGKGTSFSAPIVTGAISFLWSNRPYLTNKEIYEIVLSTWDNLDKVNPNYKWKLWKFLNVEKLVNLDWKFADVKVGSIENDVLLKDWKYIYFRGRNFSKNMYLSFQKTNIRKNIQWVYIDKNNVYFDISGLDEQYRDKRISFSLWREYGRAYNNKIIINKMKSYGKTSNSNINVVAKTSNKEKYKVAFRKALSHKLKKVPKKKLLAIHKKIGIVLWKKISDDKRIKLEALNEIITEIVESK